MSDTMLLQPGNTDDANSQKWCADRAQFHVF